MNRGTVTAPAPEVLIGAHALRALEEEIDGLVRRSSAGVTSSSSWTIPSFSASPADAAWGVTVRDDGGALVAASLFVDVPRGSDRPVSMLAGAEGGSHGSLLAVGAAAGDLLCAGIAGELKRRDVAVDLGPVAHPNPLLGALAKQLPDCHIVFGEPIPFLRRTDSVLVDEYLSASIRRTLRKARNRVAREQVDVSVEFLRDNDRVVGLLPSMEIAYRDRDHEAGRASLLDSSLERIAWRERVLSLVRHGVGEVAVLHLNGVFSAYVVGVLDGSWYGIQEGRFVTAKGRFSPGRVLEAAVLERVLKDSRFEGIDWMSAVAPESLLATNGASPTARLVSLAGVEVPEHLLPHPREPATVLNGTAP
jgi:hypothetical protein